MMFPQLRAAIIAAADHPLIETAILAAADQPLIETEKQAVVCLILYVSSDDMKVEEYFWSHYQNHSPRRCLE